jgi:2-oxoglutarate dehydrogenase E2 component (dihydrolipoamide succinyltransferase)
MTGSVADLRVPVLDGAGGTAVLAAWCKQPGEPVAAGEVVAEVEVDKAVLEVAAPAAGILGDHLVGFGATVEEGQLLAAVEDPGTAAQASPGGAVQASPGAAARVPPAVPVEVPPGRVPLSALRRRIGANLVRARATQALVTTVNEVDVSVAAAMRERYRQVLGVPIGLLPFFVRAAVVALREFPDLNAEIDGTDVVRHDRFDIGIATATERGLVVPVLRGADRASLTELDERVAALAAAARAGTLPPRELTGGTFTVTNGGVFGSLLSTPIVNPPQTGILGMHAVKQRPVVVDGAVVARPMMNVALTYDHRLVDGADAVGFLARVIGCLESPDQLLAEAEV